MNAELVAIITAAVGLYLAVSTRGKNNADAAESLTQAAKNLVEAYVKENEELRKEIRRLNRKKRPSK